MLRRRWLAIAASLVVIAALIAGGFWISRRQRVARQEARPIHKPQAPPDLAKLRDRFTAALEALHHNDGVAAAQQLASFDFGGRAVEEYRLYYLAKAHAAAKQDDPARATFAKLIARQPKMVLAPDAGTSLGQLYAAGGDWYHAGEAYAGAGARWASVEARFDHGDLAGAFYAARNIAIKEPDSEQAGAALTFVRRVNGMPDGATVILNHGERFERALNLLRDNNPQSALDELTALEPVAPKSMEEQVDLQRGIALMQLKRHDEAVKELEPLTSGSFDVSIPALYNASKSYRALAASINPIVIKVVTQKQKVGTIKVRQGKGKTSKLVTKPKFANVKKNVQLIDLAKKAKKDEYDRLATERLKDLLLIHALPPDLRFEVLNSLAAIAEAKNQDPYLQTVVGEIVKIDRFADPGLQHFWDKAWAAYTRGDLNGAMPLLRFIADTYGNPNVKRQAEYWYARTIERAGRKAEAAATYQLLAAAPYEDVYASYSEARGAKRQVATSNPLDANRPDWSDIAEKSMPPELRLAYELTALTDMKDAQQEIRKNATRANHLFSDALLADLYNSTGGLEPMYRSLRSAFPALATVEQDSVPPYFLKMYYPIRYQDAIKKYSSRNSVDPFLVMALILQESYFNPRARSRVGAIGLMQLMPATGQELGRQLHGVFKVTRLEDPTTNIEIGTMHLEHLIGVFGGEVRLAIASYNAGEGNVAKWRRGAPRKPMDEFLESIPFPETRNYVKRVTLLRSSYARMAK
jgi:soluble lytic murein transglycosylase-like protein/tetratricopeptide (TPR) repeat protein